MGHGKVPLFSLWQGIHLGDRSKTTGVNLQEAHDGNFPMDPEIDSEKLPISVFQCCVQEDNGIQLPIIAVNMVTVNIPYSSNELDNICEETWKDPTINILMHYISTGWPCELRMLPQELHMYRNFWDELSVKDGLVTKSSKLLIPSTLRQKVMEQIHEGHQGIEKCMLKARESVYWLGIIDDIWEAVESVEFANLLPELQNQLEMSVKFHHMHATPLELICSTGTKW